MASGSGRILRRAVGPTAFFGGTQTCRPFPAMDFVPGLSFGRPCDLPELSVLSSHRSVSLSAGSPAVCQPPWRGGEVVALTRWVGRLIGLDVHRDFCVVAICEDGRVRSGGRVPSSPEGLSTLAESLVPSDRGALEVTGSCWEVARLLEPHVQLSEM
jgi:hypothetical protein